VTPTILPALGRVRFPFQLLAQAILGRGLADQRECGDWRGIEATRTPQFASWRLRLDLGDRQGRGRPGARRLSSLGPALVDAGGDVAASGPRGEGQPWPVRVANPLEPGRMSAVLRLERGGAISRDFRRWRVDGRWRHHTSIRAPGIGETDVLAAVAGLRCRSDCRQGGSDLGSATAAVAETHPEFRDCWSGGRRAVLSSAGRSRLWVMDDCEHLYER
jgi:hypothetical protein